MTPNEALSFIKLIQERSFMKFSFDMTQAKPTVGDIDHWCPGANLLDAEATTLKSAKYLSLYP